MKWKSVIETALIVYVLGCVVYLVIFFNLPPKSKTLPCSVHSPSEEGPLYLVCIGSGTVDTVDAYGQNRLLGKQDEYGYSTMGGGLDECSGSSYTIFQIPDDAVAWVSIKNGDTFVDIRDINDCFCEKCYEKIKAILPWKQKHTYILYDAVAEEFHPISIGTEQIGNYLVESTEEKNGYYMVVTTLD